MTALEHETITEEQDSQDKWNLPLMSEGMLMHAANQAEWDCMTREGYTQAELLNLSHRVEVELLQLQAEVQEHMKMHREWKERRRRGRTDISE